MASDSTDAARLAMRSRALKYELVISLKTAKPIGLEVTPKSLRYLLTRSSPIRYILQSGPGWRDRMQFNQLKLCN